MSTDFKRTDRIAEMMQRKLSQIIQQEVKDPRLPKLITISAVTVTRDLGHAKIYFTVLNDAPGLVVRPANTSTYVVPAQAGIHPCGKTDVPPVMDPRLRGDDSYKGAYLQDEALAEVILNAAASYLRSALARTLTLRTVPQLHFIYDNSIEYGRQLSRLIDDVNPPEQNDEPKTDC